MRRARSERERKTSQAIASRASLTARARAEGCRRVGEDGASVAAVAREFGIGWATAMAAVREHGRPRVDDPSRMDGIEAMGLEETVFSAASATRATSFITGIRLLDVVAGRSASALARWMHQRTTAWRAGIGVAALDPYRGYASALRASLPHATRVLDAFPGVRWGFATVDQVRCRIQRQQTGHRGRAGDPLYGIRRLLRRAPDHHPTTPGLACWPDCSTWPLPRSLRTSYDRPIALRCH
jgi:transposase